MRDTTSEFPDSRAGGAAGVLAGAWWVRRFAPWALELGLSILVAVILLTMPGNPILDLNHRQYRELGTIASHAGVLLLLAGLLPHGPASASSGSRGRPTAGPSRESGGSSSRPRPGCS